MEKFNFKNIDAETLHVEADLEEVFSAVRSRLVALGGKIKKSSLKEGILDAAWRYGVNFFGLHVTVQFRAIGDSKIELHFSGGFKDAFDTTGAGREKAIAVMNDVMEHATPPEPIIKSVGNNAANLKSLSNAKFLKWFLLLNGSLVLTLIWTGPGALVIPVLGFGGALFSLVFAKWLAKKAHDIKTVDPLAPTSKVEEQLHAIVANLAQRAGLPNTPEIGIYESPDMNAFATGINPGNALVAFSTGLLETMDHDQIQAVAAHEIAHVANRDMLGIVLLQGVTNSIEER